MKAIVRVVEYRACSVQHRHAHAFLPQHRANANSTKGIRKMNPGKPCGTLGNETMKGPVVERRNKKLEGPLGNGP